MSGILQADWTSSCLEPVEERMSATHAMSPDDSQKAQVTFLTNADGITSVSAPMSGKISPPVEVKFSIPPEDQIVSTRVEVEPNIQSGGVVKGLPNFSELGVSDTCKSIFAVNKAACLTLHCLECLIPVRAYLL